MPVEKLRVTVNGRPVTWHRPGVYGGDWRQTLERIQHPVVEIAVELAEELGIDGDLRIEPTSLLPDREAAINAQQAPRNRLGRGR